MKNKARSLGHPIHPILVVFPMGLFTTAVILDVLFLLRRFPAIPAVIYYMIAAGILSGLLAAVFGAIDWLGLPPRSRAWGIALLSAHAWTKTCPPPPSTPATSRAAQTVTTQWSISTMREPQRLPSKT